MDSKYFDIHGNRERLTEIEPTPTVLWKGGNETTGGESV